MGLRKFCLFLANRSHLHLQGSQELKGKMKACGNSTELCGFLRRSSDEKSRNYEETHDAFLHTAATEN
ncbi:hypothetical protein P5673_021071 [Acropora cervicornis]|uniref:Uncharacterized protein n=1 Tax=Acropora cervicornis TaxID=6130 RepID=A0AAD9Q8V0_ACRCE|nr:hypothetical protein P5673_021071 [Acropora cervicornis]